MEFEFPWVCSLALVMTMLNIDDFVSIQYNCILVNVWKRQKSDYVDVGLNYIALDIKKQNFNFQWFNFCKVLLIRYVG